ncbi:MAG TPA: hypothetical protein VMX55_15320 [candidate division Zixibacteria bacterium]|nr:hypothetical protein [candidate division Zixibacteria bacterium]
MFRISGKNTQKFLLFGILAVNGLILISFIFFILLSKNIIPDIFYVIAIPVDILSNNLLFLIVFFLLDIGIISYNFYKTRKITKKEDSITYEDVTMDSNAINFDANDFFNNDIFEENREDVDILPTDESRNELLDFSIPTELTSAHESDSYQSSLDDELDLTPSYLSSLESSIEDSSIKTNLGDSVASIEIKEQIQKKGINDYQFAFYQMIVNDGWLFEKAADRERIGFDHYAIDEAKISLSDIENLINSGMLYKQIIQHPTGSFVVYSSQIDIEKVIIKESLRRIIRKKRLKFVGRKFDFDNWQEFGFIKKTWEFDFEIASPSIIGLIWTNEVFLISDNGKDKSGISQDKKEELKALIASVELKLKDESQAIIITNLKENYKLIKKIIQSTGWGEVVVLYFADTNFTQKFLDLLED